MAGSPLERFKEQYQNWRYDPFSDTSLAVDKQEDHLYIPASSPYQIQLLELPRKNTPSTVTVYCYDTSTYFTEVATPPAQSQFRVDYPPTDGKGTGLIQFSQNDANKQVKINYKATGSPILEEFLNTKLSWPAGTPTERQIVAIVSAIPVWRNNPIRYFHEGNAVYNAAGESESCVLFRFKKSSSEGAVLLELKGAKLHQAYYSELAQHLHAVGTLAGTQPTHTHAYGTLAGAQATHVHGNGTLAGTQPTHTHGYGTLTGSQPTHVHAQGTLAGTQATHVHGNGTLAGTQPKHTHGEGTLVGAQPTHQHGPGTLAGTQPTHRHSFYAQTGATLIYASYDGNDPVTMASGLAAAAGNEAVVITGNTASDGNDAVAIAGAMAAAGSEAVTIAGNTSAGGGDAVAIAGATAAGGTDAIAIAGAMAAAGNQVVTISGSVAAGGGDAVTIAGSTANTGVAAKTYPNACKIYVDGVDRTASFLSKSGLGALGDGTSGHAFVTTGSGECNVSDWFPDNKFYEIKVTEPNSAGGRILLHLELY